MDGLTIPINSFIGHIDESTQRSIKLGMSPECRSVDAAVMSVESPVARALLGKSAGDVVTVQRPKGPTDVTIVSITYSEGPPKP